MNDWEILKARYGSNRQYQNRQLLVCDWEDFKNFLIDQGADILTFTAQHEMFRFKLGKKIGIVYDKRSGNLLAHDMGALYNKHLGWETSETLISEKPMRKVNKG